MNKQNADCSHFLGHSEYGKYNVERCQKALVIQARRLQVNSIHRVLR